MRSRKHEIPLPYNKYFKAIQRLSIGSINNISKLLLAVIYLLIFTGYAYLNIHMDRRQLLKALYVKFKDMKVLSCIWTLKNSMSRMHFFPVPRYLHQCQINVWFDDIPFISSSIFLNTKKISKMMPFSRESQQIIFDTDYTQEGIELDVSIINLIDINKYIYKHAYLQSCVYIIQH